MLKIFAFTKVLKPACYYSNRNTIVNPIFYLCYVRVLLFVLVTLMFPIKSLAVNNRFLSHLTGAVVSPALIETVLKHSLLCLLTVFATHTYINKHL